MEFLLNILLPVILYLVVIILCIVLIVLCIRSLKILDKVDRIVDNIDEKVQVFDGAFSIFRKAAEGIASISDSFVFAATSAISKLIKKIKTDKEEDDYE